MYVALYLIDTSLIPGMSLKFLTIPLCLLELFLVESHSRMTNVFPDSRVSRFLKCNTTFTQAKLSSAYSGMRYMGIILSPAPALRKRDKIGT